MQKRSVFYYWKKIFKKVIKKDRCMLKNFLVIREGTIKAMIKKKKRVIEKSMEIISSILCQRHDMQFDNL